MSMACLAQTPSPPQTARWSFFRLPKTTFQRVLQNQVQIDFDDENYDFCDENINNFVDYGDENDQKQTNTMAFRSLGHYYFVKKTKTPLPPP